MSIKNIRIFKDTQGLIKNNESLGKETTSAIENTMLYPQNFRVGYKQLHDPAHISVEENLTLIVARRLKNNYERVAVLNFANAIMPGGGVTLGANAQEEYLCRASNLYNCLLQYKMIKDFYLYHLFLVNTYYSDKVIYSKGVVIFKKDVRKKDSSLKYDIEYTKDWIDVDIITSAAPNIRFMIKPNMNKISQIFMNRIRNILETAIENKIEALVLGAFGCGEFKNPPEIVSEAFRKILKEEHYEDYFKEIVFAIKHTNQIDNNLSCFKKKFEDGIKK